MEGWKGGMRNKRGHEEEEGEEVIILIITLDTFLHQKEVGVHIKSTPGSLPQQLSLSPLANGPKTRESLIGEQKGQRKEEEGNERVTVWMVVWVKFSNKTDLFSVYQSTVIVKMDLVLHFIYFCAP